MSHIEWKEIAKRIGAENFNPGISGLQEEAAREYILGIADLIKDDIEAETDNPSATGKMKRKLSFIRKMVHLKENIAYKFADEDHSEDYIIEGINSFLA